MLVCHSAPISYSQLIQCEIFHTFKWPECLLQNISFFEYSKLVAIFHFLFALSAIARTEAKVRRENKHLGQLLYLPFFGFYRMDNWLEECEIIQQLVLWLWLLRFIASLEWNVFSCIKRLLTLPHYMREPYGLWSVEWISHEIGSGVVRSEFVFRAHSCQSNILLKLNVTRSKSSMFSIHLAQNDLMRKAQSIRHRPITFGMNQLKARVVFFFLISCHISHFFGDMGLTENGKKKNSRQRPRMYIYTFSTCLGNMLISRVVVPSNNGYTSQLKIDFRMWENAAESCA